MILTFILEHWSLIHLETIMIHFIISVSSTCLQTTQASIWLESVVSSWDPRNVQQEATTEPGTLVNLSCHVMWSHVEFKVKDYCSTSYLELTKLNRSGFFFFLFSFLELCCTIVVTFDLFWWLLPLHFWQIPFWLPRFKVDVIWIAEIRQEIDESFLFTDSMKRRELAPDLQHLYTGSFILKVRK